MKTSELSGRALDYAVHLAHGANGWVADYWAKAAYPYSTDWMQGGPIIEREHLGVWFSEAVHDENGKVLREACWYCETCCTTDNGDEPYRCEIGDTPLIAAMRCYVASKLGDEIEIPEELK